MEVSWKSIPINMPLHYLISEVSPTCDESWPSRGPVPPEQHKRLVPTPSQEVLCIFWTMGIFPSYLSSDGVIVTWWELFNFSCFFKEINHPRHKLSRSVFTKAQKLKVNVHYRIKLEQAGLKVGVVHWALQDRIYRSFLWSLLYDVIVKFPSWKLLS